MLPAMSVILMRRGSGGRGHNDNDNNGDCGNTHGVTSMVARMIVSMGAIHDCKSGACFQSYITHIGLAEAGGATVMLWPEAKRRILRLVYWCWVAGLLLAGSLVGWSTGWLDQVG